MGRIIKIKFIVFFVLIPIFCNAEIKPPFKNISVSKNPIYYEDILFEDFDGKIINLKQKNSKIYVLNFWATWCLPCKWEMPYLDKLQLNKNIEVFPINIGPKDQLKTKIFFRSLEIKNLSIFFDSENKIVIADIGHYESEQFTKDLIYDLLVKNFTKFAVRLSKVNTNPIKYL